ncbi:anti-sigma-D factor RsdA [Rhodococcus sp. B50]|uniref:anti-sigma-D factor RsdA n=1 Tax=Rhodococcus sp. B50 TaxID=2682847 RepID=UPI001BD68553|nr:anti-sigma-D factor RsdA [Rhodococcus sp. B50]MBS9371203.1 Anti-sigma-D factor RsdA [Rhodococcus sp. B50]
MGRGRFSGDGFDDEFPDDETSVDLAAVRRDNALIDAIAGNGLVETKDTEEYELATLLADWRAEILADPMPAGPDLDEVVAAVHRELGTRETLTAAPEVTPLRPRSKGQLRLLRPLAGAAALVAVAVGTATAVSYGAEPGDPLWGVKQVVFSEQAQSTEARIDTTSTLQRAEQLIAEGNAEEARELLTSAESRSGDVRDAEERDALGDWLHRLADEIGKMIPQLPPPPVAAVPPAPAPGTVVPPPATTPGTEGQLPAPTTGAETGTTVPPTSTTVDPTILQAPQPPVSDTTTPSQTAPPPPPPPPSSTPPPSVPSEPPPSTSDSPTPAPTTASSPRSTQDGPGADLAPGSVTTSEGG